MTKIQEKLFELRDEGYKNFHSRLMPGIDPDTIIGVRIPVLRKYARELAQTRESEAFLTQLPHKYYDENNLHAFILEQMKDYEILVQKIKNFLPYIDNWATCDSLSPPIFKKNKHRLCNLALSCIASDKAYTIRFGIGILMKHYLDEYFCDEYMRLVANIKTDEYYVNMMRAWYFAEALAKQYDAAVKYLECGLLDSWTHNKAVQKASESRKINDETKKYLRSIRR